MAGSGGQDGMLEEVGTRVWQGRWAPRMLVTRHGLCPAGRTSLTQQASALVGASLSALTHHAGFTDPPEVGALVPKYSHGAGAAAELWPALD